MNVQVLITIGVSVMLLLAVSIVIFIIMYQRSMIAHQLELKKINDQKELELIQASIQSEEEERNRIAAELHDDVVATLASARLYLYKTRDMSYDEHNINQSKALLDQSISSIRNISHKLQPATLQHLGLERSLQSLLETIHQSGVIKTEYTSITGLPRIADHVELAAYRISQELITNILKHSGAGDLQVGATATDGHIEIVFTYRGSGMSQQMYEEQIFKKGATGLKNIVNRLKSINASIKFDQLEEQLFTTTLTIPLTEQANPPAIWQS